MFPYLKQLWANRPRTLRDWAIFSIRKTLLWLCIIILLHIPLFLVHAGLTYYFDAIGVRYTAHAKEYVDSGAPLTFAKSFPQVNIKLPIGRNYDLDKLAKAIALHETGDCTAKVGSALVRNCYGFRNSKGFMRFETVNDSHEMFKRVWTQKYGDEFPKLRHATSWVCGPNWPTGKDCPGGSPRGWLSSVSSIYSNLQ